MESSDLTTTIGLMSGTSMDGIDAAVIRTDGQLHVESGPAVTIPYDDDFRAKLRSVLGERGDVTGVERELTDRHAAAVRRLLDEAGLAPESVDIVGFHGHTIRHEPDRGITRQIGDGARLAAALGIDVVDGLRYADVAAGGEGAPLAPVYHRALAGGLERPVAVLNLGGVGNVTWIGPGDDDLLAFDTGPANAPLDDWCRRMTGQPYDAGGVLAAGGQVDRRRLDRLMEHAYFGRKPPKSLDRDEFASIADSATAGLGATDGAALLAAFSVAAVVRAVDWLPVRPARWIVCGGGRRNPVLMSGLRSRLGVPVDDADTLGWDGDALEAQAFAYLAVRSRLGLPISFPGTTHAPRPMTGGRFWPKRG
ncbi:anhydro-N-acetylmuramic acid kinase [Thalassobaculum sp.]|uniref:anhydro-N-acetylmuramic acid kinase n=1 Tax=Thalassobaculum sp. TaxID=2022740 RepID=UPI0032F0086D